MAKINVRQHTDGYKEQKNFDRVTPVDGTYDVVNVKYGFQKVGARGTEKCRIITHVLRVVEAQDADGAKAMVGHTFGQDIWWNLFKEGDESQLNYNGQRLVNLAIACGCDSEFDPEDRDGLGKLICGTPYRIKIAIESQRGSNGKDFYNVNVSEVKHFNAEGRKKYMSAPDWKKIVGNPAECRMEDQDYSTGGKSDGGGSGKASSSSRKGSDDDLAPTQDADPFLGDDLGF